MTDRGARRLAWLVFALTAACLVATEVFIGLTSSVPRPSEWGLAGTAEGVVFAVLMFSFSVAGILIAARLPRSTIGWLLLAIGATWQVGLVADAYALYGLRVAPGKLPGAGLVAGLTAWTWVPSVGLVGTFLLLLFPDGRLPSPRWRAVAWLSGTAMVLASLVVAVTPETLVDVGYPEVANPLFIPALGGAAEPLQAGIGLIPISIVACAAALIVRFRRSRGTERLQMKWLAFAAAVVAILYGIVMAASFSQGIGSVDMPFWVRALQSLAICSFVLIPVAVVVAVLKYRLYDIDVVINKTVVYASLAAFITGVYVAIVVGIGALIGAQSSRPNLGLSILATGVVAVAFQPVRERVQRFANRLVYGQRATPYEVLSEFAEKVATSYAVDDVLPRMARTIAEGTGAERAEVLVGGGADLHAAAVWPEDAAPGELDVVVPVVHRGEQLGALAVRKPPGERLTPGEEGLVRDLASQAGLVLRNVRLVDDLRSSRQRLVTAQGEERRRLERDIHDGAQQQLVALAVKLKLARTVAPKDAAKADELFEQAQHEAGEALETLRDLARGIYPPLLADQGLAAALESQARRSPLPVTVSPDGIGRYPQDAEAAVYFCCLEALQNIAKYAGASRADLRLSEADGKLRFEVTDDGAGFDAATTLPGSGLTNMRDRMEALGGSIEVRSVPGQGTTVSGWVPVSERASVS